MINRRRARSVARQSAEDAARLIAIQETEIATLKVELNAALTIVAALAWGKWDYVDPKTGEVTNVQWLPPATQEVRTG